MEVKKALRRLSLTKQFIEVIDEKKNEKMRLNRRRRNSGDLRMMLRESVRDSIRMGAIMGA